MNFSAWSIRQPIPSILLFIILTAAGFVGFKNLNIQNFPDFDLPAVTVTANLPGANPSQIETEITRKIEDSVASIGSIEHITSSVNDGTSVTTIQFQLEKNVQEAVNDVRDAVSRVRSNLPTNVQEPIISRVNISGAAILTFGVESSTMDESELSWFIDNDINKALLAVPGVAQVNRLGGVEREVRIELDPTRLAALGVTAGEISNQLKNVQQESPGGRTKIGGMEQSIRTIGTINTVEELAAIQIPLTNGRRIPLNSVARLLDTHAERRQMALFDGKPVISFQVFRARGFGEVAVAEKVRKAVEKLQTGKNSPIKIQEISNTIRPVNTAYEASMHALYEGALLAVLIVWLFLRDWRATFVSAVALPLSILPTFAAMYLLGYSLNTVTLLALTLVVGILVDDAIVEVENIVRHLRNGKKPLEAALEAADEIGLAVIATSLTLVAVFVPTAFMGGIPGKFFKQFGWSSAIAVLASLLVARLLTPMMAAYLLKPMEEHPEDGPIMRRYLKTVRWCMNHPFKTSLAAAVFFIVSMGLIRLIPATFIQAQDQSQITVTLEVPPGSNITHTKALAEQTRKLIQAFPEVTHVYTAIGTGNTGSAPMAASSAAEVRKATLTVKLLEIKQRERSQQLIETALRKQFQKVPGARFSIGIGGSGEKYSVVLAGDDAITLHQVAQRVVSELRTLPNLGNISSSASLLRPEVVIKPDFARAAQQGVTVAAIGQAARIATTGDYDVNLPRLNLTNRQLYVRVQLDPEAQKDLNTIKDLRIPGSRGSLPLDNVANIYIADGPSQISRYDRSRNVTVDVELQGRPLGEVTKLVDQLPSLQHLPEGIHRISSGDVERMQELFGSFFLAMAAGVFCIYAILILLFDDFLQPITILAALPLAVGGAFGMLALFHFSLSLATLIGLLMLMGIVTKNSILLVEYAIMARKEQGLSRTEAMIDACHKRARPIIMTTVAMIAGMVPMAMGLEGDSSFRAPMAATVIGGLITSTALSLLVVPVVFELVDEAKLRTSRVLKRFSSKSTTQLTPSK